MGNWRRNGSVSPHPHFQDDSEGAFSLLSMIPSPPPAWQAAAETFSRPDRQSSHAPERRPVASETARGVRIGCGKQTLAARMAGAVADFVRLDVRMQ